MGGRPRQYGAQDVEKKGTSSQEKTTGSFKGWISGTHPFNRKGSRYRPLAQESGKAPKPHPESVRGLRNLTHNIDRMGMLLTTSGCSAPNGGQNGKK
jgi:hypothetical protein